MILLFFSGRRLFCTQAMKNWCSLEFIHRAAIYKIPIKPRVRNRIQHYSLERIRLNKTWMTLKLTKILVSLLVMNPLKKNDKGSDDPKYDTKFMHQNSSKIMCFFHCAKPWYGYCVYSLNIHIMSCPSKVPFKFPLHEVKIDCMYRVLLKFRQHKLKKIFTVNLTFTIWCQIINEYFVNFCGLLRKYELYSTGFN